jgi:hypothetical protein
MQLQLHEKAKNNVDLTNPYSLCWRGDLVKRYESLWSILHKFALLNAVKATDVRKIFLREASRNSSYNPWIWRNRDDLRYLGALDPVKMGTALNLTENFINESLVSNFVKQNEVNRLSCETLRYCSRCLRSGFHSPIYQLLFFDRCPIHKEKLITACQNCGSEISYRLNIDSFKKPYGCPKCQIMFCASLSKTGGNLVESAGREVALELVSNWLLSRIEFETLESSLKQETAKELSIRRKSEIISHLTVFWSNTIRFPVELKAILKKQLPESSNFIHVKVKFNEAKTNKEGIGLSAGKLDSDLYSIYKSISRHFLKTQLFEHRKCINSVGRNTWWGQYVLSCKGKICAFSNAFLLWRMYFEGLDHPANLFRKYKGNSSLRAHIDWQPPTYNCSESVLKRLFAFECYWIFSECLLIAKALNSKNIYSFNTFNIKKENILYWIVAPTLQGNITNYYDFYYWLS